LWGGTVLKIIGAFIVLITGFWFTQGMFDLYTILWFVFGVGMLIPIEFYKTLWEIYERKRHSK
jgi:membrane-bound ClpP family serine protease